MRKPLPYPIECLRLGIGYIVWSVAAWIEWLWVRRHKAFPLTAGLLILGLSIVEHTPFARASGVHWNKQPSTSRYISWMTGEVAKDAAAAEALGCESARTGDGGTVLLAFGKQVEGGTRSFDGPDALYSHDHISAVALGYATGLDRCGDDAWTLAIATSNYRLYDVDLAAAHGAAWQRMVNDIRNGVGRVRIAGGIDLEPGWGGADAARAWMGGWAAAGEATLVVNASADGCPLQGDRGACSNGWDVDLLASLVWGTKGSVALPQIYRHDGAMASQWGVIARAWERRGGKPVFAGPMTQVRACRVVNNANCPQLSVDTATARMQLRDATGGKYPIPPGTDVGWG